MALLQRYDPVKKVEAVPGALADLYVTVEDAGKELPDVLNQLEDPDGPDMIVASAEELPISYDEVFIRIMQQQEQQQEAAHG